MCNMQRFSVLTFLFVATLAAGVLPATTVAAQERMAVEAIAGEPFGVGRISFDVSQDMLPEPLGVEGIGSDREARPRALSGNR